MLVAPAASRVASEKTGDESSGGASAGSSSAPRAGRASASVTSADADDQHVTICCDAISAGGDRPMRCKAPSRTALGPAWLCPGETRKSLAAPRPLEVVEGRGGARRQVARPPPVLDDIRRLGRARGGLLPCEEGAADIVVGGSADDLRAG